MLQRGAHDGWLICWLAGLLYGFLFVWLGCWPAAWLAWRPATWLADAPFEIYWWNISDAATCLRLAGLLLAWLAGWAHLVGLSAAGLVGCLADWPAAWLACCLAGLLACCLVSLLPGWPVAWVVVLLPG